MNEIICIDIIFKFIAWLRHVLFLVTVSHTRRLHQWLGPHVGEDPGQVVVDVREQRLRVRDAARPGPLAGDAQDVPPRPRAVVDHQRAPRVPLARAWALAARTKGGRRVRVLLLEGIAKGRPQEGHQGLLQHGRQLDVERV